jgi:hypothetical protein
MVLNDADPKAFRLLILTGMSRNSPKSLTYMNKGSGDMLVMADVKGFVRL